MMDGLEQFVLTPESESEQKLIGVLTENNDRQMSIHRGGFYECQGGWFRQKRRYSSLYSMNDLADDDSAIICLRPITVSQAEPQNDDVPVQDAAE
jgi:hypothetical protein